MIEVFTIGELEKLSGVSRSTIHFYLSIGLLPRPQKLSTSRSLYTLDHLQILKSVCELKESGLSLTEIEKQLEHKVDAANESSVDLAAQEYQRMHERILSVAAQELTEKGYKDTHITTIVRKLGITTAVFYSHFSSKRRLLAECSSVLIESGLEYVDSKEATTKDPAERLLWLCFSHLHVFRLGATALALTRVEEFSDEGELHRMIQDAFKGILEHIERDVSGGVSEGGKHPAVSDELIAQSLFAAYEQTMFRMLADTRYRLEDVLLTHLWIFLAIRAARSGEIDIDSRLSKYTGLIQQMSSQLPPLPPLLER
ncbi:MAG: MerR family transcriptional regulator [Actinobacteria bacterium]|nr:MerR family transcriptional regulator [Actinomycetota bacterium]